MQDYLECERYIPLTKEQTSVYAGKQLWVEDEIFSVLAPTSRCSAEALICMAFCNLSAHFIDMLVSQLKYCATVNLLAKLVHMHRVLRLR
jgi:hypothetical protein